LSGFCNASSGAPSVGAAVTTETMVALLGESFLIQTYIIRRDPALRKTSWRARS
jgi:hypothetical protein